VTASLGKMHTPRVELVATCSDETQLELKEKFWIQAVIKNSVIIAAYRTRGMVR